MGTDLLPFDEVTALVATVSVLGILLLTPLYLSQRRDVQRLRAWMQENPEHPVSDLALSESRLDKTEVELEKLYADRGELVPGTAEQEATEVKPGVTPPGTLPAAARVTSERPALERITMERAALVPHPRWRRFVNRATQPLVLIAIGAVALVLGAGAIVISQDLLSSDEGPPGPHVGALNPKDVKVAVFNGTAINGLAGLVSSDLDASGYDVVATTSTTPGYERTVVIYADHQKPAAQKVAGDLGVKKEKVQAVHRDTRDLVAGADVVVIAGEDRA
jgi:hypothetical protein